MASSPSPHLCGGLHQPLALGQARAALIAQDPDYGEIFCRCECVTKAEIKQAAHNILGVSTVSGMKYRTRATMGRCQGGFCSPRVVEILARELNCSLDDIMYDQQDSTFILSGHTKSVKEEA